MTRSGSPPSPTAQSRRRATRMRFLFVLTLLLVVVGLLHVAYVARTVARSTMSSNIETGIASDSTQRPSQDEILSTLVDSEHEEDESTERRSAFRTAGITVPKRDPPRHRPGDCAFLATHHREARFIRDDACFSRPQVVAILRDLVIHAAQVLAAHNITYWLESGSLLGAYRHHDVIPHDDDGDLAIDAHGFETLRSTKLPFNDRLYAMDVWDSPYYENSGRDAKLSARLVHKPSALYVDVFVFYDRTDARTGRAMVGPVASDCYANCVFCRRDLDGYKELVVPREWVYPLVDCVFGHHTLKCPARTVEYLTHEYGDDFMEPI